jgi:integrase
MVPKLSARALKVRKPNSGAFEGDDRFTGKVTYSVVGTLDGKPVRFALGTDSLKTATARVAKLEECIIRGPAAAKWPELEEALPRRTLQFFSSAVGYASTQRPHNQGGVSTWANLTALFEAEMDRMVENKNRGAQREDGTLAQTTKLRYMQTIRSFTTYLAEQEIEKLNQIGKPLIALFKAQRLKQILKLKQARGGGSVALDIAVLHRIFAFGIKTGLMSMNPIMLENEPKPGKKPVNGARPFTATELTALREHAGQDLFTLLVLRWTGLRGSDAINLRWRDIRFDRGVNGEIEVLTQKRSKIAIVPLSTELRNALEDVAGARYGRKIQHDDFVLYNPETNKPFVSRWRLYRRIVMLGVRAKVARATPHCLRDTFACDMLAREASIYDVAKMLADTVETVEKSYAQFVPAARDAAQSKMDAGIGIEERARMAQSRGKKVVNFR